MGFATALSGLAAASTNLQVIGNNIANANTTGFKESRAEFADVYNSTGKTTPGSGVKVSEVAQQFAQGNVESTQNNLDLALSGNGFFALGETNDATRATAYTRNGAFHLSPEGYITNDTGHFLMGGSPIGTTVEEGFNTGAPQPIRIDTSQGAPAATTTVDLKVNLDSRDGRPVTAFTGYDPETSAGPNLDSYNNSTSATIFDSLGNTHTLTTYFVDETPDGAATSTWAAYVYLDGRGVNTGSPATLDNPDATVSTDIQNIINTDSIVVNAINASTTADTAAEATAETVPLTEATVTAANAVTNTADTTQIAAVVAAANAAEAVADDAVTTATAAAAAASTALADDPANADLIAADAAATAALADAIAAAADAATAAADAAAITDAGTLTTAKASAATAVTSAQTAAASWAAVAADTAADTAAVVAATAAVATVTGVTQQQIDAANAAAALTSATVTSVLTAAASAELRGTKIPITFDSLGNLTADTTGTNAAVGSGNDDFVFSNIDIAPLLALNVSAEPLTFAINPTGSTQYAADFGVNDLQQNGYASGNLTGVSVDKTGVVLARYSNGTTSPLGQVILGRFTNNQGLNKIGDTTWQESIDSGTVVLGVAGGNNFGDITSSALENSNTDIATQLVKLIVAQQTYQANAQTISTEDEIIQRILQL